MGRYNDDFDGCCLVQLFYTIAGLSYVASIVLLIFMPYLYAHKNGFLYTHAIPITVCTVLFVIYRIKLSKQKDKIKKIECEYEKKKSDLEIEYQEKHKELTNKISCESTKLQNEYKEKMILY